MNQNSTITSFAPGDRIRLPSGRTGTVVDGDRRVMPNHELVQLDEPRAGFSARQWFLRSILDSA